MRLACTARTREICDLIRLAPYHPFMPRRTSQHAWDIVSALHYGILRAAWSTLDQIRCRCVDGAAPVTGPREKSAEAD